MIKIAVLSDLTFGIKIKEYVENSALRSNVNVEVTIYLNFSHLYEALRKESFYDIIFLDIDKHQNEVLKIIYYLKNNKTNNSAEFVFMSGHQENYYKFLKFEPLDYFLKPLSYTKIDRFIRKYICNNHLDYNFFVYTKNNIECKIAVSQIVYLYEFEKNIILHTKESQIEFEGNLSDCLNESCFNNFIATEKILLLILLILNRSHVIF